MESVIQIIKKSFIKRIELATYLIFLSVLTVYSNDSNGVILFDDYSDPSVWTRVGVDPTYYVRVNNGECQFHTTNNVDHRIHRLIGTTLNPSDNFKVEFDFSLTSNLMDNSATGHTIMALTAGKQSPVGGNVAPNITNQDGIIIQYVSDLPVTYNAGTGHSNKYFKVYFRDGTNEEKGPNIAWGNGNSFPGDFHIVLKVTQHKVILEVIDLNQPSDVFRLCRDIPANMNISGLKRVQHANAPRGVVTRKLFGKVDNLEIDYLDEKEYIGTNRPDLFLSNKSGSSNNTSIAMTINPVPDAVTGMQHDFTAIAYDNGANFDIQFIDNTNLSIFHSVTGISGNNPDLCFFQSVDALIVVYEHGGNIVLKNFAMAIHPSGQLLYVNTSTKIVGAGSNPNIDSDDGGALAITWENSGTIYIAQVTPPNLLLSNIDVVGSGSQPDIAVARDPNSSNANVAVTFVNPNDQLEVQVFDYFSIGTGLIQILNQVFGLSNEIYSNPRICYPKNQVLSYSDFSIACKVSSSSVCSNNIFGITYNSSGMGSFSKYLINEGLEFTDNDYPVLTYTNDKIIYAWSTEFTVSNSYLDIISNKTSDQYSDIVLKSYYANTLIPVDGKFYEINQSNSAFGAAKPSIATRYDPNTSSVNEGVAYASNSTAYWKHRIDPAIAYRKKSQNDESSNNNEVTILENSFKVYPNPAINMINIKGNLVTGFYKVNIIDMKGSTVYSNRFTIEENKELNIDVSRFNKGVYLLQITNDYHSSTKKIVIE